MHVSGKSSSAMPRRIRSYVSSRYLGDCSIRVVLKVDSFLHVFKVSNWHDTLLYWEGVWTITMELNGIEQSKNHLRVISRVLISVNVQHRSQ